MHENLEISQKTNPPAPETQYTFHGLWNLLGPGKMTTHTLNGGAVDTSTCNDNARHIQITNDIIQGFSEDEKFLAALFRTNPMDRQKLVSLKGERVDGASRWIT